MTVAIGWPVAGLEETSLDPAASVIQPSRPVHAPALMSLRESLSSSFFMGSLSAAGGASTGARGRGRTVGGVGRVIDGPVGERALRDAQDGGGLALADSADLAEAPGDERVDLFVGLEHRV